MKKRETAAIIRKPPLQIIPPLDFMDGLVMDKLFQNECGRLPADPFDPKKAGVEPRVQKVPQVGVNRLEIGILDDHAAQILTHSDNGGRTVRSRIQQPEQLLSG